jgi:hypothetical protein
LPSWLAAITSPVPILKPLRTGSEMKSARKPRRSSPAASSRPPTMNASVAAAVTRSSVEAIAVAVRIAIVDVVLTLSAREAPSTA